MLSCWVGSGKSDLQDERLYYRRTASDLGFDFGRWVQMVFGYGKSRGSGGAKTSRVPERCTGENNVTLKI